MPTSVERDSTDSPYVIITVGFIAAFAFCLLMNVLSAGIPAWRASRMNITDAINQR